MVKRSLTRSCTPQPCRVEALCKRLSDCSAQESSGLISAREEELGCAFVLKYSLYSF